MRNKLLLIITTLFCFMSSVSALEMCEMSDEYKAWLELSTEEKKNVTEPVYCKEVYLSSSTLKNGELDIDRFNKIINEDIKYGASESRYSSVDLNIVTEAKNQTYTNACWAYSSASILETSILKNQNIPTDLSEAHMEYRITKNAYTDKTNNNVFNRNLNDGGTYFMAASYMFDYYGAIFENEINASNLIGGRGYKQATSGQFYSSNVKVEVNTFEYKTFNDQSKCTTDQISEMKTMVKKYGSVGVSMYYTSGHLKDSLYYVTTTAGPIVNHAVTIVGWDDSISASKFNGATRNGAFIAKNSWGTSWGNNGFFYISYDDVNVCKNMYSFDARMSEHTYGYVSNPLFFNSYSAALAETYTITKFHKQTKEPEILDKISLGVLDNMEATVYVVSNLNDINDKNKWLSVGTVSGNMYGITSLNFNGITISQDFAIVVKYKSGSYMPLTCRVNSSDSIYADSLINSDNLYGSPGSWKEYKGSSDGYFTGCTNSVYAYTSVDTLIRSNYYNIYGDYIYLTLDGETSVDVNTFKSKITTSKEYKLLNSSNEEINEGVVVSGTKINIDGKEYTIIVPGDANLDGSINSLDYVRVKNHITGYKRIDADVVMKSADANLDGDVNSLDYVRIKNTIMKGSQT